ncbi:hypothetical protein DFR79_102140 [Halanaerobium saccharolyticum]|uniref:YokE-like PH domain-containing protein n=1 Tax=Halanaerobium saccharolyticum TaxID=43595 RepID=A0A4R6M0W6_9FIRM|nr:hypothetical protein [Halanaerobium saccharolyticum]TDO94763.1 hypothetical protein DFR79_102140 [Halanaerobium saccharolyticum]
MEDYMENLKERVDKKIIDIFSAGYEAHYMLKKVLKDDTLFVANKDIIDVIFIEREEVSGGSANPYEPAKVIIATTYGIIFLEEGFREINDNLLGYRLKKTYYNKIDSVELDICLLNGSFRVYSGGNVSSEVEFSTAKYFKEFEEFMSIIHENIMEN